MSLKLHRPEDQADADRIEAELRRCLASLGPVDDAHAMHACIQLATRISERMGGNERAMLSVLLLFACGGNPIVAAAVLQENIAAMRTVQARNDASRKAGAS